MVISEQSTMHETDVFQSKIPTFLKLNLVPWPGQRVISRDWVNQLKEKQYETIRKFGRPIIPGSFVVIIHQGHNYLADGQHRRKMLSEMSNEGTDFGECTVTVEFYHTDEDSELGNTIYQLVNDRYHRNGNIIDGKIHNDQKVKKVVEEIQKRFGTQCKCKTTRAPYFDIQELTKELNTKCFNLNYEEILEKILKANEEFGQYLLLNDGRKYRSCSDGFYLPYKSPKCRWVQEF